MLRILFIACISILALAGFAQEQSDNSKSGTLHIQYNNLKSTDGNLIVKLYNSKSPKFPDTKSAIAIKTVKIADLQTNVTFDHLPYGQYAFTTFHDENANGKMDTNMIHFPTEGNAFSNNLKITFGPPSFEKASFKLQEPEKIVKVNLSY